MNVVGVMVPTTVTPPGSEIAEVEADETFSPTTIPAVLDTVTVTAPVMGDPVPPLMVALEKTKPLPETTVATGLERESE